jgi:WD40 repeat protein
MLTSHWQLRSLVSSPEQNIIYYPSGTNVVALNTKTREREIVTKLSFSPRCLTASKDWLCCGGDQGIYTAVCLDDGVSGLEPTQGAEPDSRLPLDLEPPRQSIPIEGPSTSRRSRGQNRPAAAEVRKVGTEIVNCITLWSPSENASNVAYKVPVAVVSNNDCTVSVLNVRTSETLEKLTLPDFVNRSVMSPDGRLLATICDDPFLYIHERKQKSELRKDRFETKSGLSYDWLLAGRIQLEGQYQGDKSTMRGSFAACFSRSGKYLAIATQYGLISVFDTESLPDPGSLLVVFTSSRPGGENGAIRAMEFSPGPFDLLAWTEASGRVGVADVRTLFLSRQRLDIDSHASGVERVIISDRAVEPMIDPRLRSFRTDSPSISDYLGLDLERRQLRHLTREMLDRHQAPLTAEE